MSLYEGRICVVLGDEPFVLDNDTGERIPTDRRVIEAFRESILRANRLQDKNNELRKRLRRKA